VQGAQAGLGTGGTKADYLSKGRSLEKSKKYGAAIDAYLLAKKAVLSSADDLEEVWGEAVRVARKHMKNRYMATARDVSSRLVGLKKIESACELLREIGEVEEAVTVAIGGQAWNFARELSSGNRGQADRVEQAYRASAVKGGDTSGLMEMGHTSAALDVLAQRGDWAKLWKTAEKERVTGGELKKFSAQRVQQLVDEGDNGMLDEAVDCLLEHGAPTNASFFDCYRDVVMGVLGRSVKQEKREGEGGGNYKETVGKMRQVLFDVATSLRAEGKMEDEFENLLMATHYVHMMHECER